MFCDLVFAGVPMPEPGAEVYAEAFKLAPGGVANRAVAAARLGARTALLSQLGDDPLGVQMAATLAAEPNLDLSWLSCRPGFQSPVTVSLAGRHEREFITYQEEGDPLEWPVGRPTVGATHVSLQRDLPEWVGRLRAEGTTVYGGVGWDSSGAWSPTVLRRLEDIDVFVPNDLEAMRYTQTESACEAAYELGRFVELAIVTRGSRGLVAYERAGDRTIEIPSVTVPALDPTGAGDVFVAAFMATCTFGWPLEERLRLAGLCASLSVRTLGGASSAPGPADITRFLAEASPAGDWSLISAWAAAQGAGTNTTRSS
ncbi:MAG TPA: PfkB family carbohydrate kinase [Propionibacteriaceae bacterium]|nr:PfkB family carbohydrate kinase [Propionibacteriaceae bacterium]